ncbi:MAG TPA: hypothetical protein VIX15_04525 [Streptosporangiaceae bacterium]
MSAGDRGPATEGAATEGAATEGAATEDRRAIEGTATEHRRTTEGTTTDDRTATEDRPPTDDRTATEDKVCGWFAGRIPADWFTAAADIQVDREEITIVGPLAAPDVPGGSDAERAAAARGRIRRFREETRNRRVEIAREAEHRFRRKVSWGVTCADASEMFTTLSVPVMTRLRQPERRVLDTLVDAGVARSRSDALAWCVRLTGENADSWLSRLRVALRHVEEVREEGPASG